MPDDGIATLEDLTKQPEWSQLGERDKRIAARAWVQSQPEFGQISPMERNQVLNQAYAKVTPSQVQKPLSGDIHGEPSDYIQKSLKAAEQMQQSGSKYVWGGDTPKATDCSGFTCQAYAKAGIKLPRTAREQFNVGQPVEVAQLQPGDQVFFQNTQKSLKPGEASHTGIYIGNGEFRHQSSAKGGTTVSKLSDPVYASKYLGAKRRTAGQPVPTPAVQPKSLADIIQRPEGAVSVPITKAGRMAKRQQEIEQAAAELGVRAEPQYGLHGSGATMPNRPKNKASQVVANEVAAPTEQPLFNMLIPEQLRLTNPALPPYDLNKGFMQRFLEGTETGKGLAELAKDKSGVGMQAAVIKGVGELLDPSVPENAALLKSIHAISQAGKIGALGARLVGAKFAKDQIATGIEKIQNGDVNGGTVDLLMGAGIGGLSALGGKQAIKDAVEESRLPVDKYQATRKVMKNSKATPDVGTAPVASIPTVDAEPTARGSRGPTPPAKTPEPVNQMPAFMRGSKYKSKTGEVVEIVKSTPEQVIVKTPDGKQVPVPIADAQAAVQSGEFSPVEHAKGVRAAKDLGAQVPQKLVNEADRVLAKSGEAPMEKKVQSITKDGLSKAYVDRKPVAGDTWINAKGDKVEIGKFKQTPTGSWEVDYHLTTPKGGRSSSFYVENPKWATSETTTPPKPAPKKRVVAEKAEPAPGNTTWVHGTDATSKESILKSGRFTPNENSRKYRYSEWGRNAVYFSPPEGEWLTPDAGDRRVSYSDKVEARIDPTAKIRTIRNPQELDALAQDVDLPNGQKLMDELFVDGFQNKAERAKYGAWPEENYTRSDAVVKKLIEAGVDGVHITKEFGNLGATAPDQLVLFRPELAKPVGEKQSKPPTPKPTTKPELVGEKGKGADAQVGYKITERDKNGIAKQWTSPEGDTVTIEVKPKTSAGTGGKRYVARSGNEEFRSLSLEGAQKWISDKKPNVSQETTPPEAGANGKGVATAPIAKTLAETTTKAQAEKVNARGFTKTQEKFLGDKLREAIPDLPEKVEPVFLDKKDYLGRPTQERNPNAKSVYEHEHAVEIKVPNDGKFTVASQEQANNLLKAIGQPVSPVAPTRSLWERTFGKITEGHYPTQGEYNGKPVIGSPHMIFVDEPGLGDGLSKPPKQSKYIQKIVDEAVEGATVPVTPDALVTLEPGSKNRRLRLKGEGGFFVDVDPKYAEQVYKRGYELKAPESKSGALAIYDKNGDVRGVLMPMQYTDAPLADVIPYKRPTVVKPKQTLTDRQILDRVQKLGINPAGQVLDLIKLAVKRGVKQVKEVGETVQFYRDATPDQRAEIQRIAEEIRAGRSVSRPVAKEEDKKRDATPEFLDVSKSMQQHFGLPKNQADTVALTTDARARSWASRVGRNASEWYKNKIVTKGGTPGSESLFQENGKTLVALHNTNAGGIVASEKLGGIPAPAIAIIKAKNEFNSFGDITLVGKREMIDPQADYRNKVYSSDVYSPRQPRESHDVVYSGMRKFQDTINQQLKSDMPPGSLFDPGEYHIATEGGKERFIEDASRNPYVRAAYLKSKGEKVSIPTKVDEYGRTRVERWELDRDMRERIKDLPEGTVEAWVAPQVEGMFKGPYLQKGRGKVPYTIDNLVDVMTKAGIRGGEKSMFSSLGANRAKGAKEFGSVEAMHKAEGSIVTEEGFRKFKDALDQEFGQFQNEIMAAHETYEEGSVRGAFDRLDDSVNVMGAYLKGPKTEAGMRSALRRNGFTGEIDAEIVRMGQDIAKKLMSAPTEYFEAKPKRAVKMNEMAGAVVPKGTSPEVIESLKRQGIADIRIYDRSVAGDRLAKVNELAAQNEGALFQDKKAAVEFARDGKVIIRALNNPDVSSAMHEFAHVFRRDLAEQALVHAPSKTDLAIAEAWAGVKDGKWETVHEEKFARGFERYLRDGKAPNEGLKRVFENFKTWLTEIYKTLKGSPINVKLSPEMRGVFDRLLTEEEPLNANQQRSTTPAREQVTRPAPVRTAVRAEKYDSKDAESIVSHVETLLKSDEFNKEKRGVRTHAETQQAAKTLGLRPEDIKNLPSGVAVNAETLKAMADVSTKTMEQAIAAQRKAKAQPTDANKIAAIEAQATADAVYMKMLGKESEAGRALNIVKTIRRAMDWDPEVKGRIEYISNVVSGKDPKPEGYLPPTKTKTFGSQNKVFTKDKYSAAVASLKQHAGSARSGVDPRIALDLANILGYYIEGGVRSLATAKVQLKDEHGLEFDDATWDEAWRKVPRTARESAMGKTNRDRLLKYLVKKFGESGAEQYGERIAKIDPESPEALRHYNEIIRDTNRRTGWDKFSDVTGLSKGVLASIDISAPGRQGLLLTVRHPFIAARAFGKQIKSLSSEKRFEQVMEDFENRPRFLQYLDSGLAVADVGPGALNLNSREEAFRTGMIDSLYRLDPSKYNAVARPLVRTAKLAATPFRASERAYVTYLNEIRGDVFDLLAAQAERRGVTQEKNPEQFANIADTINTLSGRGSLGKLERSANLLSNLMFAPRYVSSRVKLFDPRFYKEMTPEARKETLTSLAATIGTGFVVLKLMEANGAKVDYDPTSTDFLKVRFPTEKGNIKQAVGRALPSALGLGAITYGGETRYDIFGGMTQYIRLMARMQQGRKGATSLTSGAYGQPTRADEALQFLRTKSSPAVGFVWDMLKGKKINGQPAEWNDAYEMFVPLIVQEIEDAYKQDSNKPIMGKMEGLSKTPSGSKMPGLR